MWLVLCMLGSMGKKYWRFYLLIKEFGTVFAEV